MNGKNSVLDSAPEYVDKKKYFWILSNQDID